MLVGQREGRLVPLVRAYLGDAAVEVQEDLRIAEGPPTAADVERLLTVRASDRAGVRIFHASTCVSARDRAVWMAWSRSGARNGFGSSRSGVGPDIVRWLV